MEFRRSFILISVIVAIVIAALVSLDRASSRPHPSLYESASIDGATRFPALAKSASPVSATKSSTSHLSLSSAPQVADHAYDIQAASPTHAAKSKAREIAIAGDLNSSPLRRDTFDQLANEADQLFSIDGENQNWTVNQQDMDQLDYSLPNGEGDVTQWFGQDENGNGVPRAQEAQLPNGEVVDRWFNEQGGVEQVSHQYGPGNSVSVYYYENGRPEAIRVIRNGAEIFTKFNRDGQQIQRTFTPSE